MIGLTGWGRGVWVFTPSHAPSPHMSGSGFLARRPGPWPMGGGGGSSLVAAAGLEPEEEFRQGNANSLG